MMNGYPSIGQAMRQAGPVAGQCRCRQRCVCRPGQPCRCASACSCSQSTVSQASLRVRSWTESGENELRSQRVRGAWLRARARNMLQQRRTRQQDWTRRTRLNSLFARRFNWSPSLPRVGSALGSPSLRPDSRRFMFALARWQQRNGLPATGILTPGVLRRLLAVMRQPPVASPWAQPPLPPAWPSQGAADAWTPPPAAEPPPPASDAGAAAPDDAAMPLPGDEGQADGGGDAGASEFAHAGGFRSRRAYAY